MNGNTINDFEGLVTANVYNPYVEDYWKMVEIKERFYCLLDNQWEEMSDFDLDWFNNIDEDTYCIIYTTNGEEDNKKFIIQKSLTQVKSYDDLVKLYPEYGV